LDLIRFRGHLPERGYDVPHVAKPDQPAARPVPIRANPARPAAEQQSITGGTAQRATNAAALCRN
jgi:hypothetical protein